MHWKQWVKELEQREKFEEAIAFMEKVIETNHDELDCYIFMLYLLVDFAMEPHKRDIDERGVFKRLSIYDDVRWQQLATHYFKDAYTKFVHHKDKHICCDFLYYVGHICVTGFYMCGIDDELSSKMIAQAKADDPDNLVYRMGDAGDKEVAQMMFNPESSLRKMIAEKGSVGANLLGIFSSWAQQETGRWSEKDTAILRAASLA